MDQSSQFDNSNPFFSPAPSPPPLANASNALSLPPEATYPSKEALFEAIQSWAKLRGYAFTISRSSRLRDSRQKVTYACDRYPLPKPQNIRDTQLHTHIRDTQSRGIGCLFSILALETPNLGWEVRYRFGNRFNTHNHPPSQSPAAHPSHRRLPVIAQNMAQNLFLAGKTNLLIKDITKQIYRYPATANTNFTSEPTA
jgi:hypothetical protein